MDTVCKRWEMRTVSGATEPLVIGSFLGDTGIILLPVSISQMSKLRLRKAKQFLQDQLTVSRDWNPSSSALAVKVLTTLPTS